MSPLPPLSPSLRRWLAVLLVLLTGGTITIVADTGPDGQPPTRVRIVPAPITVDPGGPGHAKIKLTPAAQAEVVAQEQALAAGRDPAIETGLHETVRPTAGAVKRSEALTPPGQPEIPAIVPLATVHTPGCTTALVRNYSSRHGAPVLFFFVHWTGSWATGEAIVRWFDTAGSQASSHYITNQQGQCWLAVAESQTAWTEANANRWGLSVEIQNPGVLPLFRTPAARAVVLRLIRRAHHVWKIPYRRGIIRQGPNNSCVPVRSGILAHRDAGACGGGHPDVGAFDLDGLIREAAAGDRPPGPPTAARVACRKLNWHRVRARRDGHWSRARGHRARDLKATIVSRGYDCPAAGQLRRAPA